jgi:hypothetical protein
MLNRILPPKGGDITGGRLQLYGVSFIVCTLRYDAEMKENKLIDIRVRMMTNAYFFINNKV